jgi:hypothetical protein
MKRKVGAMAVVALLATGAWLLTASLGRSAAPKAGIEKLADAIAKTGKPNAKQAADIAKNNDLDEVMGLFKPPKPGGKGGLPILPKGIESGLGGLAKKGTTKPADVAKAAAIIQAIAEVSKNYKSTSGSKDPASWSKFAQDMQKAGKDLEAAAKAKNNARIKVAAGNIQAACNSCHEKFRD